MNTDELERIETLLCIVEGLQTTFKDTDYRFVFDGIHAGVLITRKLLIRK